MRITHPDDSFVDNLAAVIQSLISGETTAAVERLRSISRVGKPQGARVARIPRSPGMPPQAQVEKTDRTEVSKRIQAEVFARDHYICRYCGCRTISLQVTMAVSDLYPEIYRLHRNWKYLETDQSFWMCSTSLEHMLPVSRADLGTDPNDVGNLLTASARCNYAKNNSLTSEMGLHVLPRSELPWDGLSGSLPDLVRLLSAVGVPRKQYVESVRAFEAEATAT